MSTPCQADNNFDISDVSRDDLMLLMLSTAASLVQLEMYPNSPFATAWAVGLDSLHVSKEADLEKLVKKLSCFIESEQASDE